VPGSELPLSYTPTLTLHDFRWDHALYAGTRLFGENFPKSVTAFLIEGSDFGFGDNLSKEVRHALPIVVQQVLAFLVAPQETCNGRLDPSET